MKRSLGTTGSAPSLGGGGRERRPREEKEVVVIKEDMPVPETEDKCVGGGPGPGMADLEQPIPIEESKKVNATPRPKHKQLSPEQLNKHGTMYDRKLRQGPGFMLATQAQALMCAGGFPAGSAEAGGEASSPWPTVPPSLAEFTELLGCFRKDTLTELKQLMSGAGAEGGSAQAEAKGSSNFSPRQGSKSQAVTASSFTSSFKPVLRAEKDVAQLAAELQAGNYEDLV